MRIAAVLPLLLVCGCLLSAQVVIGPTVDERGQVGAMVRVRGTSGVNHFGLMGTGELAARQAAPHGLFATGVGLFSQVDLPRDYVIMANLRLAVLGSNEWSKGGAYAFGGALGFARDLKTKDELVSQHRWQGWALGAELACDRQFGLGSPDMVLAPGFLFEYAHELSD